MARRRCQHRGEGEAVVLAQFAAREVEVRNAGLDQKTGNQDGSRAAYLSPVPLCVRLSFVIFSGSGTVVVGGVDSSVLVVADRAMRVVLYHDDAAVRVVDEALPTRCWAEPRGAAAEASSWRRRGENTGLCVSTCFLFHQPTATLLRVLGVHRPIEPHASVLPEARLGRAPRLAHLVETKRTRMPVGQV